MASQDESTRRGVRRRQKQRGARGRHHDTGSERQYLPPSGFCALCYLTLGSQEKRVSWGEGFAHPSCVARLRRLEAA